MTSAEPVEEEVFDCTGFPTLGRVATFDGSINEKIGKSESVAMASSIVFFLAFLPSGQSEPMSARPKIFGLMTICIGCHNRRPTAMPRLKN